MEQLLAGQQWLWAAGRDKEARVVVCLFGH